MVTGVAESRSVISVINKLCSSRLIVYWKVHIMPGFIMRAPQPPESVTGVAPPSKPVVPKPPSAKRHQNVQKRLQYGCAHVLPKEGKTKNTRHIISNLCPCRLTAELWRAAIGARRLRGWSPSAFPTLGWSREKDKNRSFWCKSVWTLACCEWHTAAPGLNPLRLPRAPESAKTYHPKHTPERGYQVPLRDCARSCNNREHMRTQLSTIDVTGKTFFERLYLVLGLSAFETPVNFPYAPNSPLLV